MTQQKVKIYHGLWPLAWIYGGATALRNRLFDWGWLRSARFDVPVICIGNLAVGGTGKTPHTEYLIRLLQTEGWRIATLSRGYKRRSRGYLLGTPHSTAEELGDEPCQMKRKFPDVMVAVDADRCRGIRQLLAEHPSPEVILLDDAFQHRHVQAGLSILLTDYNRLWCDDALLPAGRLREAPGGKTRAQLVVVTKCPTTLTSSDCQRVARQLALAPHQQLYFSYLRYGTLHPLFPEAAEKELPPLDRRTRLLLVSGIAHPEPLIAHVESLGCHTDVVRFSDHHAFRTTELQALQHRFEHLEGPHRLLLTTEKDAVRLLENPSLPSSLKPHIYVLPIEIVFTNHSQQKFNQTIIDYVRTYSRNRSFPA